MIYSTLVSTEILAEHLNDPDWVIFDCRFMLSDTEAGRRDYRAEHIPGARYAHLDEDLSASITATTGRHPLPDPDVLAGKLGAWGVDNAKQVVVYDDSFGSMAVRLWWLLRWLGHDKVALLDGVYPKWKREGHPLTAELPRITPAHFTPHLRPELFADAGLVETIRQAPDYRLIDARPEERFTGEIETLDKVAGHIPGAVNLVYEDNLDLGGDFMSAEELRELYGEILQGVNPDHVVHTCGSGVTAAHNMLAMEHAGLKGSRLYVGSWSEWIIDPARPIATGEQ